MGGEEGAERAGPGSRVVWGSAGKMAARGEAAAAASRCPALWAQPGKTWRVLVL